MTALQIRNLPDDVHRILKSRAAQNSQSLSEYAGAILRRAATTPTNAELWDRIRARTKVDSVSTEDIVAIIRHDRETR